MWRPLGPRDVDSRPWKRWFQFLRNVEASGTASTRPPRATALFQFLRNVEASGTNIVEARDLGPVEFQFLRNVEASGTEQCQAGRSVYVSIPKECGGLWDGADSPRPFPATSFQFLRNVEASGTQTIHQQQGGF